jgi:hypothetical protein
MNASKAIKNLEGLKQVNSWKREVDKAVDKAVLGERLARQLTRY